MTILVSNKKNIILNPSLLSTLMGCPRLSEYSYILNLIPMGRASKSLIMGLVVHKGLEVYYQSQIDGESRENSISKAMVRISTMLGEPNYKLEDKDAANTLDTTQQYLEFYKNDHWVPLATEDTRTEVIYEDDEMRVMWKCRYDLRVDTNQGILPVDHKTSSYRKDTLSLNNQFMGQCVLDKVRSIIINKIGFQTSLKPAEKFTRVVISYSADRLIEWQEEIIPYYARLFLHYTEMSYFPPNFTHCDKFGICSFKSVCESNRNMRETELKTNFIQRQEYYEEEAHS